MGIWGSACICAHMDSLLLRSAPVHVRLHVQVRVDVS